MKTGWILFFFLFILSPQFLLAQSKQRLIFAEVYTLLGYGSSATTGDSSVPSIGSTDLGFALGVNIKKVSLGFHYDYRILTQFSDVDATVGNRRGSFISPGSIAVGANLSKVKLVLVLINSGTYDLMNINSNGKKVSFTKPSGIRLNLTINRDKKLKPIIFYEKVSFSGMNLDGVDTPVTRSLDYLSYGVGVKYDF